MAKKKPTSKRAKLLADQAVAVAEFAAKACIAADELRIKTKLVKQFPLDEAERATVAEIPVLPANLKEKLAKEDAAFTIIDVASMLMAISQSVVGAEWRQQLLLAMKLKDCLQENIITPKAGKSKPTDTVYQLKITLANVKPLIWRRIEIKDCTLSKLNDIIQIIMGWDGYHLWGFDIGGEEYGDDLTGEMEMTSARKMKLSQIVQAGGKKFGYTYDFGDSWDHVIQVEKVLAAEPKVKYPRCVKGSRACPPEDCGGPWGYGDFLEAIKNPKHEQHEEMLEWIGGEFDPEAFELEAVNKELAGIR